MQLCTGIVWESANQHALSLCQGLFEHFNTQLLDRLFPVSMHVPFMLHLIDTSKEIFSNDLPKGRYEETVVPHLGINHIHISNYFFSQAINDLIFTQKPNKRKLIEIWLSV